MRGGKRYQRNPTRLRVEAASEHRPQRTDAFPLLWGSRTYTYHAVRRTASNAIAQLEGTKLGIERYIHKESVDRLVYSLASRSLAIQRESGFDNLKRHPTGRCPKTMSYHTPCRQAFDRGGARPTIETPLNVNNQLIVPTIVPSIHRCQCLLTVENKSKFYY